MALANASEWFKRLVRKPGMVAVLLGLLTVVTLTATAPDIGVTWDEPAYIAASESYVEWFKVLASRPSLAFQPSVIAHYWQLNREHPPLDKIWSGLVWSVTKNVLDDLTAHRLGNILLVGGLVAMLYLLVARHDGSLAGLMAVLALMTMPRFFFHAHLAALDMPAAVVVFATIFCFWYTQDRPAFGWDVLLGLVWGLAIATKVNAVFVPPTLLLWVLFFQRRTYLFRRLVVMGLVAVPVFLGVWPWLYDEFGPRLDWYIRFVTVDHWKIGQYYLGRFYMPPPWHFPLVIVLAITPLTVLALCLAGVIRVCRKKPHAVNGTVAVGSTAAVGGLLILNALAPLAIPVLSGSLLYDNDRLFMPAFPFLAALAGMGFKWLSQVGRSERARLAVQVTLQGGLVVAAILPQIIAASRLYPHLLSYYSETVGGLSGATRLKLETTYWCETYATALSFLNSRARPGDVIWVDPWSYDVMFYYQLQGRLRRDVSITWPEGASSVFARQGMEGVVRDLRNADLVLVEYRQTSLSDDLRRWLNGREPDLRLEYRGIPLMDVYERRTR